MKTLREVGHILEAELSPEEFDTVEFLTRGKNHPQVTFTVNGFPIKLTMPWSPSDRRWSKQFRADVRRTVRGAKEGASQHQQIKLRGY